jgi:hypothetical protein
MDQYRDMGSLIAAAFDEAAEYSDDADEIAYLATRAVAHILERIRAASAGGAPEPFANGQVLSPNARRAAAAARMLIPGNGPHMRVRPPHVLRLLHSHPSSTEEDATQGPSGALRLVE